MGIEIRLPQINGTTEREQLIQLKSYLYQLSEQLQWAFDNISTTGGSSSSGYVVNQPTRMYSKGLSNTEAELTFNSLKSLIIKSADIVNAYYEEINARLESIYVAQSDFGAYAEQTSQEIEANSTSTTQRFENIQAIITGMGSANDEFTDRIDGVNSDLQSTKAEVNDRIDDTDESVSALEDNLGATNDRLGAVDKDLQDSKQNIRDSIQGVADSVTGVAVLLEDTKTVLRGSLDDLGLDVAGLRQVIIGVTAYLKSGLLYYTDAGIPVYGLEVGQTVKDEVAGTEVFNKYARFTAEKLSFYDSNGNEVAYISDKKLYIRIAEITISLKLGGLISLVMASGDVVEKWVGGN